MAGPDGARRPRRERADNAARRRRQIIDAALRSVVRHGLAGTTLATVSAEAGLSQGVAVFYFGTKQTLLVEALKALYEEYRQLSQAALKAAGDDPVKQVAALVRADFDPKVCNDDALAVWHAFWGEANARPLYAQVAAEGDEQRLQAMRQAAARLLTATGHDPSEAGVIATIIDALIDGLWLQIYLSPEPADLPALRRVVAHALSVHFPEAADRIRAELAR